MTFDAAAAAGHPLASTVLASGSSSTSTISQVTPGVLGFLVVAGLGAALVFLLRSMNKQFRKIGPKPEEEDPETAAADAVRGGADEAYDDEAGREDVTGTATGARRPTDERRDAR